MTAKKPKTLTQRVTTLERECKRLRTLAQSADDRAECAFAHARNLAEHVGRLLREKDTLMSAACVPQELRR